MEDFLTGDENWERDYSYLKTPDGVYMDLSTEDEFISDFFISSTKNDTSGLTPNEKALEALQFFKTAGYSNEQATGIVANLAIESGNFSEDVIAGRKKGDGGKAVGLAQWHPNRWNTVSRYLSDNQIDPYSFYGQLMAVDYELKNHETSALKHLNAAKSHRDATIIFNRKYERSADYSTKRESYADELYNRFQSVGDSGITYNQYGGRNNPNMFIIKNPYLTEDIVPNDFLPDIETLDMSGYGNTLQGQQDTFNTLTNISTPEKMFVDAIDKKGSQFINTTKQVIDFIKDRKQDLAKGVSNTVGAVNQNLGERRRREQLRSYYNMINDPEYYYDDGEGIGGTILNY